MKQIKIGVAGCHGRMGQEIMQAAQVTRTTALSAGLVRPGNAQAEKDLGTLMQQEPIGIPALTDTTKFAESCDVIIDFTTPALTLELAALAASENKALITGTTGFTAEQQHELEQLAQEAVIVQSFNMSLGVNLLAALVEQTAAILDEEFDIEILEMHHRHKVDAPSGTALMLGGAAAKGRKVNLNDVAVKQRDGVTDERNSGDIGFAVLRGGGVVGDHTVMFANAEERIELTHRSQSRAIYAKGAIKAALWAAGQTPGLYSMRDVLDL